MPTHTLRKKTSEMRFGGPALVVGEFISSDAVLRGKYAFLPPAEMVPHLLEEESPPVNEVLRRSRTLVSGAGFGYGSGRESPARALKEAGITLIVSPSFGRMFYRNLINQGILAIECPKIADCPVQTADDVVADLADRKILWRDRALPFGAIPSFLIEMICAGGLVAYCRSNGKDVSWQD